MAGGIDMWLLPDLFTLRVAIATVVVTHVGLLMVIGPAILRRVAGWHRGD
ncbi:MAG: hypothetical protein GY722_22085 [bacterium]|nr:hypothetical protein [bacterium]